MEMSLVATRLDCAAMERDCSDSDGLKGESDGADSGDHLVALSVRTRPSEATRWGEEGEMVVFVERS